MNAALNNALENNTKIKNITNAKALINCNWKTI